MPEIFLKKTFYPIMKNSIKAILLLLIVAIVLQSCGEEKENIPVYDYEAQLEKDSTIIAEYLEKNNITALEHASGLRYVTHREGSGSLPEKGSTITAHYKGTFLDGTKFDSSYDRGKPFEFTLGAHRVIAGWEIGFSLLKEDSKATLYVPSGLAYGQWGQGPIGPNEVLVFEVELLDIN